MAIDESIISYSVVAVEVTICQLVVSSIEIEQLLTDNYSLLIDNYSFPSGLLQ